MYGAQQQQVRVAVSDEGVGFDTAGLSVGAAAKQGFGLFSIRERLELMGGGMDIETTPGKGTSVTIFAPNQAPAAPAAKGGQAAHATPAPAAPAPRADAEAAVPRRNGKIRVLLADDHKIFRIGLANLLRQEPDLEVVAEAGDGEKAVAAALQTHPNVVLMDVTMPRLDGIEATRRIAAALPDVCIVGLSAHEEEDMAEAMRQAGAALYLSKDSLPETLIAAVRGISSRDIHP
jgi:CheY-like chemotaxis protein